MRIVGPIALCLLAVGCATPAERAAQAQREVEQMIQIYGPACDKLGYATDSDRWRDCILQLNARDEAQRYGSPLAAGRCFGHRGVYHCLRGTPF
jgi:hypothetical protein